MGCDIHLFTEKKITTNGKKSWHNTDNWRINPYYDGVDEYERPFNVKEMWDSRNYSAFSVLADVRSDGTVEPICEPRGLPDDTCEQIQAESDRWDGDGHSHSYFTFLEIHNYVKENASRKYKGMISQEQYDRLVNEGKTPDRWCAWTNREGYVKAEWTEAGSHLDGLYKVFKEKFMDEFYCYSEKQFNEIVKDRGNDLRIVFWFDN